MSHFWSFEALPRVSCPLGRTAIKLLALVHLGHIAYWDSRIIRGSLPVQWFARSGPGSSGNSRLRFDAPRQPSVEPRPQAPQTQSYTETAVGRPPRLTSIETHGWCTE